MIRPPSDTEREKELNRVNRAGDRISEYYQPQLKQNWNVMIHSILRPIVCETKN